MGTTDTALTPISVPRLTDGTELIGKYRDSGFVEQRYLARRGDGQVVQLSELVYVLATLVDGRRSDDELAAVLGGAADRRITGEQVRYLLDTKLHPSGLLARGAERALPAPIRTDPLLMLTHRAALVPERLVRVIAGVFRPLFAGPVVAAMLAGLAVVDALVLARGGWAQVAPSVHAMSEQPALTLAVLAVILVVGAFHECGHAAACRYGGARPGAMGIGLYLVWPSFYSTVTDAYRLGRGDRLRVDLGGIYFNAVAMTVIGTAYLMTGSPWLLVTLVVLHAETMMQFLPSVRLDGYYILADLVGVPDLFARLGPTLQSALPRRAVHSRVAELKPWTRRIVASWAVLSIAFLGGWAIMVVLLAPQILPVVWRVVLDRVEAIAAAVQASHVVATVSGAFQLVVVVLPYAGLTLIIIDLVRRICSAVRTRRHQVAGTRDDERR